MQPEDSQRLFAVGPWEEQVYVGLRLANNMSLICCTFLCLILWRRNCRNLVWSWTECLPWLSAPEPCGGDYIPATCVFQGSHFSMFYPENSSSSQVGSFWLRAFFEQVYVCQICFDIYVFFKRCFDVFCGHFVKLVKWPFLWKKWMETTNISVVSRNCRVSRNRVWGVGLFI